MRNLILVSWGLIALAVVLLLPAPQAVYAQQTGAHGAPASATAGATSSTLDGAGVTGEGLRFNFRNVPLDTVLDYLGRAAGFVIVREVAVAGRVDAVSHKPLDRAQAVELLNTILGPKGFAAVRSENTLKIVTLEEARKRDSPVMTGRDSARIPKTAVMVTQIIPIRYAQAASSSRTWSPCCPPTLRFRPMRGATPSC
jgi:general secretion pathway protein D